MLEIIYTYTINTFSITKIKIFLSMIFSCFCIFIWWYNKMIEAMYILLILDFILWFIFAWKNNNISKRKMQLWIIKIITYSITLIVINYADIATMWADLFWIWIREFWVWYLSINEALSCLKHLWNLWVPIPKRIIEKLENYRDNLNIKDLWFKN